MRVFVTFHKVGRWAIDINPEATVRSVKDIIETKTFSGTHDDKREGKKLDISYGGASLHDEFILQDVGIKSGSTLKCELKVMHKPKLRVLLGYSDETLDIMDDIDQITTPIGDIRSILSKKTGLPVSAYRLCLSGESRKDLPIIFKKITADKFIELFDCNYLEDYGLELGATVKLEVWDGWREFINACLSGHEKIVEAFLSSDKDERQFQRRVALHIAAHFNFTGLAQIMLRAHARPDVPVGTHPAREWCHTSAHVETKKCAVHEASECGNVDVLRILIKANILSFAVRDGKGRTPWNIVVEHFHKDCFEYLLARQWGRKTGKGVSLPVVMYCRVMQWCERARNRVLVMHGRSKSTLRGRPRREGALVGPGVAVDGLSNKCMASLPLSAMPKAAVHPGRVLPALAKARRRFMRDKSFAVVNTNRRRSALSDRGSRASFPEASGSTAETDSTSGHGDLLIERRSKRQSAGKRSRQEEMESTRQINDTTSVSWSVSGKDALPTIPNVAEKSKQLRSRHTMPSFTTFEGYDGSKTEVTRPLKEKYKRNPIMPSNNQRTVMINGEKVKRIPLPLASVTEFSRPYFHWGGSEDPIEVTLARFESYRGTSGRENAIRCLTLADTFVKKPWLTRANMATCLVRRGVKRDSALVI